MPDGEYLKPVPMRCGEQLLKRGVTRLKQQGRKMEFVAQRKAMLTQEHASHRALCHYCGHCGGCEVDAKYTSANTPIPAGLATGNLKLYTDSTMTRILMDKSRNRVAGIEYTNSTGSVRKIECKALVLACSAIETARQLLINGLANGSGQVGRNLTSHFGDELGSSVRQAHVAFQAPDHVAPVVIKPGAPEKTAARRCSDRSHRGALR